MDKNDLGAFVEDTSGWLHNIAPFPRIIDHQYVEGNWVEPLRTIYDHELMLYGEGDGVVKIAGVSYVCKPFTFIIIPPGVWESSNNINGVRWQRHWVHFDWQYQAGQERLPINTFAPQQPVKALLHLPPAFVPREILHGTMDSPRRVFDLFTRLESRWNTGTTHDRMTCRALLLELLLELLDPAQRNARDVAPQDTLPRQVRHALEALSEQPASDVPPLQMILTQFGCSYAHTVRLFTQAYGMPPLAYLNALRIERAKLLLQDTRCSVQEIAGLVGYNDPYYFSRLFTRYVGTSPSRYGANVRSDER